MYREIVTRAVVGKGRIYNNNEAVIKTVSVPSKVLGCWIINHYYVNSFEGGKAIARGKYDLHVWYGFNDDTDTMIHKQTIDYVEEFALKMKPGEELSEENELISKCIKYPTCTSLNLNDDGTISIKVEKDISLDIIGEANLRVQISNSEEDWVNGEDIENIDVNYLNK
jgi:spore coat protein E